MLNEIELENEMSSPYFLINKVTCHQFETEMEALGADVQGTYGAWSFFCKGEIVEKPESQVSMSKSIYSEDDYSMFDSVFNYSEWTIKSNNLDFLAKTRKTNFLDRLGLSSYKKINKELNYRFKCKGKKGPFFNSLLESVQVLMAKEFLSYFRIENGILSLKFEADQTFIAEFRELRNLIKEG